MIEVGTLVRYKADGDFGLITEIMNERTRFLSYWIKWLSGRYVGEADALLTDNLEVIA